MELIVSEAENEDARIIIDYLNQVGGESQNLNFGFNECFLNELQEMEIIEQYYQENGSVMLLGFIDDELVSIASLSSYLKDRLKHRSNLGITVKKAYWHMGIASAMLEEIIDYAKNHHIEVIDLEVKSDNIHAIHLYQKFGFEKIGYYPKYFKIDEQYSDAILMNLYL